MRMRLGAALLGGLVVGLAGLASADPPPGNQGVKWANSWEEAVEEATARNVPIFISFHGDN